MTNAKGVTDFRCHHCAIRWQIMSLSIALADKDLTFQGALNVYWVRTVDPKMAKKVDLYVNNLKGIKILY